MVKNEPMMSSLALVAALSTPTPSPFYSHQDWEKARAASF